MNEILRPVPTKYSLDTTILLSNSLNNDNYFFDGLFRKGLFNSYIFCVFFDIFSI